MYIYLYKNEVPKIIFWLKYDLVVCDKFKNEWKTFLKIYTESIVYGLKICAFDIICKGINILKLFLLTTLITTI